MANNDWWNYDWFCQTYSGKMEDWERHKPHEYKLILHYGYDAATDAAWPLLPERTSAEEAADKTAVNFLLFTLNREAGKALFALHQVDPCRTITRK